MGSVVDYVFAMAVVTIPAIAILPKTLDGLYIISRMSAAMLASPW